MKRVFIIHGWDGTPQNDWLPWLTERLKKQGFEVATPIMPHTETPTIEDWVPHLAKLVSSPDKNTYFVGHSIGCQTIMRYLEGLQPNTKVGGAVFVAPWFNLVNLSGPEADKIAEPWITTPIDFAKVTAHTDNFTALFSDDDPWVPTSDEKLFQEGLNAKTTMLHRKGHITADDGCTELPEALDAVLQVIKS